MNVNPILTPSDFQALLAELKKYAASPIEPPMSVEDVMSFLGCGRTSVNRYMKQGMPFHRLNARPVFYASEINDWIKNKPPK